MKDVKPMKWSWIQTETVWAGFWEGTQYHNSTHLFMTTQALGSGEITNPKWQHSYILDMFLMSEEVKLRRPFVYMSMIKSANVFVLIFQAKHLYIVIKGLCQRMISNIHFVNFFVVAALQTEATESWTRTAEFKHFFHFSIRSKVKQE